jgi:UDP-glucose 4-epimerase
MKKILVTGGAGYIGSHTVVELVNAGYEPVIVDNFSNSHSGVIQNLEKILSKKVTCHTADVTDYNGIKEVFQKEKGITGVIHFAAYKAVGESVKNPLKYYHSNIGGLVTLLKVMEENDVQNLVFSSSCTVYGEPEVLPVNETFPRGKIESPYGNTKKVCEEIIEDTAKASHLKGVVLRYFNPIGAHPSAMIGELPLGVPSNLVPYITQTAVGIRESLTVFGNDYKTPDGTCIRDYIHVVDLAKAHVKSLDFMEKMKEGTVEIFNIGTGKGSSVLELVNTFEKATGEKLNYKIGPRRPGDVEKIWSEVEKANKLLGWETKYSLEDALLHSWNWQKSLKKETADL